MTCFQEAKKCLYRLKLKVFYLTKLLGAPNFRQLSLREFRLKIFAETRLCSMEDLNQIENSDQLGSHHVYNCRKFKIEF